MTDNSSNKLNCDLNHILRTTRQDQESPEKTMTNFIPPVKGTLTANNPSLKAAII